MPITLDGSTGITAGAYNGIDQADLATALNASGSAPIYACRAWVNFDGTGTVAIRASGNVTSITDGGVGIYAVNFATAMPDASYSIAGMSKKNDNSTDGFVSMGGVNQADPSTTSCGVRTFGGSTAHDPEYACFSFFR